MSTSTAIPARRSAPAIRPAGRHSSPSCCSRAEKPMKAIAVVPGRPNSVHLAELARPSVSDVANGRGVLVKVLRVGVDGTDKEINAAEYGAAPAGYGFLVVGHEGFGH